MTTSAFCDNGDKKPITVMIIDLELQLRLIKNLDFMFRLQVQTS